MTSLLKLLVEMPLRETPEMQICVKVAMEIQMCQTGPLRIFCMNLAEGRRAIYSKEWHESLKIPKKNPPDDQLCMKHTLGLVSCLAASHAQHSN